MLIREETNTFIQAVQQYSGNQLKHPADCAALVETAELHALQGALA